MDPVEINTPAFSDKALWAKLLAPSIALFVVWLNKKTGLGLDSNQLTMFIGGIFAAAATYIVSHKKAATAKALAAIDKGASVVNGGGLTTQPAAPKPAGFASLYLLLALVTALFASTAFAQGVKVSYGPAPAIVALRPGNPHPFSYGGGAMVSVTSPKFETQISMFGGAPKVYDMLTVDAILFGNLTSLLSGEQVGALTAALGLCTFSSGLCLVGGPDLAGPGGGLFTSAGVQKQNWIIGAAYSLNLDFSALGVNLSTASKAPVKGNTL